MHTEKSNERRGLNAIVGLAVAGATLMAGLIALPASKASADDYKPEDDFRTTISPTDNPKLSVTKYLATTSGVPATGSVDDLGNVAQGDTPAAGVIFNVYKVQPKAGLSIADVDPTKPGTYDKDPNQVYAGETDGNGVIDEWYAADAAGRPITSTPKLFEPGINYYVMEEKQSISPSFMPGGRYAGMGYEAAQNSFFSLPFRTKAGTRPVGYLYHLHVFPKNVNNSQTTKQVTNWVDSTGAHAVLAKPGDKISYKLNQKIYNEHPTITPPATTNNDGRLDIAELRPAGKIDLRVSDRISSALQLDPANVKVQVTDGVHVGDLKAGTDFEQTFDKNMPKSFDANREFGSTDLFPTNPGGETKYLTLDFFKNSSTFMTFVNANTAPEYTIQITFDAVVTALGDSTGASQGSIQNTVMSTNSDKSTHENPGGKTDTPSATASFGKVTKDGVPLSGATFRLVDPTDDNKYLASDGKTYPDDPAGGHTFYEATSNAQGAVVFTALPIIDPTVGTGRYGEWRIVETNVPAGYDRPSVTFSKVSFRPSSSGGYDIQGKTASDIVSHFGTTPIEATHEYLSFGRYAYKGPNNETAPTPPISVGGHQLDNYLANWMHNDKDAPVNLPLTGGRGIILLLVIGLMVMGGALYARNRRNASRA